MNSSDQILTDLRKKASRILEAFNNGELTLIEAFRQVATLDREVSQKLASEYISDIKENL